jgi:hypothetical protein
MNAKAGWVIRLILGLAAGAGIAWVDVATFGGEVTPIVDVALLLATGGLAGLLFGRKGWLAALAAWICLPGAHLGMHVLGLPDTIQPNTYGSIALLAVFSLGVTAMGWGLGLVAGGVIQALRKST